MSWFWWFVIVAVLAYFVAYAYLLGARNEARWWLTQFKERQQRALLASREETT